MIITDFGIGPEVPVAGPVRDAVAEGDAAVFGSDVPVIGRARARRQRLALFAQGGDRSYGVGVMAKPDEMTRNAHGPDGRAPVSSFPLGMSFLRAHRAGAESVDLDRRRRPDGAVARDRAGAPGRAVSYHRQSDRALGQVARAGGAGALARADAAVGREPMRWWRAAAKRSARNSSSRRAVGDGRVQRHRVDDTPYPALMFCRRPRRERLCDAALARLGGASNGAWSSSVRATMAMRSP